MQNIKEDKKLERLAKKFNTWRKRRRSSAEQIPLALLDEAAALCSQGRIAVTTKTLGINHDQLKRSSVWRDRNKRAVVTKQSAVAKSSFVEIVPPTAGRTDILLSCGDRTLKLSTTDSQVPALIVRQFVNGE